MKKVKDERLILINLQHIRIAYIIQTIGVFTILAFEFIYKGMDDMTNNPLWLVLMISTIVYLFLSMRVSVDHEPATRSPKKGFAIATTISVIISIVIGVFVSISDGYGAINGIITGAITFICFLVPSFYLYYIRMK